MRGEWVLSEEILDEGRKRAAAFNITGGVIWKQMLLFFFPLLLGSFFQQLYNTADAVIVGRFVGTGALAAVGGSSAMIVMLFVSFFTGLSSGAGIMISQYCGAGDRERTSQCVHTALALALGGGLLFTIVCILTAPAAVDLLRTGQDIRSDSIRYLQIYFCGCIPSFLYNMGAGILRAEGDSRHPLLVLIAGCLMNIALDLLLVAGLQMETAGAALATVLSQTFCCVLTLFILKRGRTAHDLYFHRIRPHTDMLMRMLRLGFPTGLEAVMYMISNLLIQASINSFNTAVVSAWAVYGKIDAIFWIVLQSLGITVTTFAGQNYGAGKHERVRRSVRTGLLLSFLFTGMYSCLLLLSGNRLFFLFTNDISVVQIGGQMIAFLARFYVLFVLVEILGGARRGMGDSLHPMLIVLFGTCLLRIAWILLAVPRWHSFITIEASYPITWTITSVLMLIYYLSRRNAGGV